MVVVIPSRNQTALIGRCLDAIIVAAAAVRGTERLGAAPYRESRPTRVNRIAVLDSCTDETGEIASIYADVTIVCVEFARVGSSRAMGIAAGMYGADVDPSPVWIANSDAESVVPVNWLTQQLRFAHAAADVALGTVQPVLADMKAGQASKWQQRHPHGSPVGKIHGANFGVRGSGYLEAGGFAALTEHEDVDLTARLRASGARVVEADSIIVTTSGRATGRTPGGYSGYGRACQLFCRPDN